jgi:hypothetical protein
MKNKLLTLTLLSALVITQSQNILATEKDKPMSTAERLKAISASRSRLNLSRETPPQSPQQGVVPVSTSVSPFSTPVRSSVVHNNTSPRELGASTLGSSSVPSLGLSSLQAPLNTLQPQVLFPNSVGSSNPSSPLLPSIVEPLVQSQPVNLGMVADSVNAESQRLLSALRERVRELEEADREQKARLSQAAIEKQNLTEAATREAERVRLLIEQKDNLYALQAEQLRQLNVQHAALQQSKQDLQRRFDVAVLDTEEATLIQLKTLVGPDYSSIEDAVARLKEMLNSRSVPNHGLAQPSSSSGKSNGKEVRK